MILSAASNKQFRTCVIIIHLNLLKGIKSECKYSVAPAGLRGYTVLRSSNLMVIFSAGGAINVSLHACFLFFFFYAIGSFHDSKQQQSLNESDPRPKLR